MLFTILRKSLFCFIAKILSVILKKVHLLANVPMQRKKVETEKIFVRSELVGVLRLRHEVLMMTSECSQNVTKTVYILCNIKRCV